MRPSVAKVNAALDVDVSPAESLRAVLDAYPDAWAVMVGSERAGVLESSGAWWAVRANAYDSDARRCATEAEAWAWVSRWIPGPYDRD